MHRYLFAFAACYNLGGLVCVVVPGFTQQLLLGEVLTGPAAMVWTDLWLFVVIMGLGNLMVAIDPVHNRGIAWMGAIGKAVFAVHWLTVAAMGRAPGLLALGALGDLTLAVLFAAWLWHTRSSEPS